MLKESLMSAFLLVNGALLRCGAFTGFLAAATATLRTGFLVVVEAFAFGFAALAFNAF